MGQSPSRTADFAGVLPSRTSTKSSVSSNAVQPQRKGSQEPRAPRDAAAAVTQLGEVPAHCIALSDSRSLQTTPRPISVAHSPLTPRRGDEGSASAAASTSPPGSLYIEPESVRKARVLEEHMDVCSEILDGFLFVSNLSVARDRPALDAMGITHVVDCCAELSGNRNDAESDGKRERLALALRDDTREDLTPFLLFQLVPFIIQCRREQRMCHAAGRAGPKVLVHCHQGVSRSCAVAIALVMVDRAMPFRDAMALVKQRRAISSPNAAFLCQLIQWGRDLEALAAVDAGRQVLNGLFRLAPHAAHDPRTLVLKKCSSVDGRCVDEDALATELWSKGVFVFQRQRDAAIVIWTGDKCELRGGASAARLLVESAVRAKTFVLAAAHRTPPSNMEECEVLQLEIVDVVGSEGCSRGRFEYEAELQWYTDDLTNRAEHPEPAADAFPGPLRAGQGAQAVDLGAEASWSIVETATTIPLLFALESLVGGGSVEDSTGEWDQLKQYDAEDLTPGDAFLLVWALPTPVGDTGSGLPSVHAPRRLEGFVWIGTDCSLDIERLLAASRRHLASVVSPLGLECEEGSNFIAVEHQNSESDRFWHVFELGY